MLKGGCESCMISMDQSMILNKHIVDFTQRKLIRIFGQNFLARDNTPHEATMEMSVISILITWYGNHTNTNATLNQTKP